MYLSQAVWKSNATDENTEADLDDRTKKVTRISDYNAMNVGSLDESRTSELFHEGSNATAAAANN